MQVSCSKMLASQAVCLGVAARQLEEDGTEGEGTHHEWIVEVRYNADS